MTSEVEAICEQLQGMDYERQIQLIDGLNIELQETVVRRVDEINAAAEVRYHAKLKKKLQH